MLTSSSIILRNHTSIPVVFSKELRNSFKLSGYNYYGYLTHLYVSGTSGAYRHHAIYHLAGMTNVVYNTAIIDYCIIANHHTLEAFYDCILYFYDNLFGYIGVWKETPPDPYYGSVLSSTTYALPSTSYYIGTLSILNHIAHLTRLT